MNTSSAVFGAIERPEYVNELAEAGEIGDAARPLSLWEKIYNNQAFRRAMILVGFALVWEVGARISDNPLLFPSFIETVVALWNALLHGPLLDRIGTSLEVLVLGYAIAIALALVLTIIAVTSSFGADVLNTLVSMFNPLPALAILPLALLWFGLGLPGLMLVMVQSVVWTVALNTFTGFQSISETLRMAGQNFGFSPLGYVFRVLLPAAFPMIFSGLKIGWAHAWRTLIGAELVFGVASRSGGLGWYIYENRASFDTANVFAGLMTIIIIGFLVEVLLFRTIEMRTIRRWGMVR
jgi:NitT/TauT family transport system permease protein